MRTLLVGLAAFHIEYVCAELGIDPAQPDVPMDRRKWPIHRLRDQPMLHRICPTILDMRTKIRLIPDVMFPKPPLPDPGVTLGAF